MAGQNQNRGATRGAQRGAVRAEQAPQSQGQALVVPEQHLAVRDRQVASARVEAAAATELQARIALAHRFPRSEDEARAKILRCCERKEFAEKCRYAYTRGRGADQRLITGPSAAGMREMARVWTHIEYGTVIVADDDETRTICSFAHDLETLDKRTQEDTFRKLIQRRAEGGGTVWITPDERDLRELTNRRAAICERNCLQALIPWDLLQEVLEKAAQTLQTEVARDPDAARKAVVDSFSRINVPVAELESLVGHSLSSCSPAEIEDLRAIWRAIASGDKTWRDFYQRRPDAEVSAPADVGGAFAGATGQTTDRPGRTAAQEQRPDLPQLPAYLRQPSDDPRPEHEWLVEAVADCDQQSLEEVAQYVGASPSLTPKSKIAVLRAIADQARRLEQAGEQAGESGSTQERSGGAPDAASADPIVNRPIIVGQTIAKIRKANSEATARLLMKKWVEETTRDASLAEYTDQVQAALDLRLKELSDGAK